MMTADEADQLGLGLQYGVVELAPVVASWPAAAARLIEQARDVLGADASAIAHIGSTAVVGMLAKPIVDIAVLLAPEGSPERVTTRLESIGYEYRGDAGGEGGLVFVLSVRPKYRVAHLHVIPAGDPQWDRYLTVVDRLQRDPRLRTAYEAVKQDLVSTHADDRQAYTVGKNEVVARILRSV
jgi:GrpB-like predicted nucleotidyltransferase (UPF0157 family)